MNRGKRSVVLRFPAICTSSFHDTFKRNMMQHVNSTGMNLQQEYTHHGNTQYLSHVFFIYKPAGLQKGAIRNIHTLTRYFLSPRFLLKEWSQIRYSPPAAIGLGVGGLIPFISAPTYLIYQGAYCPEIAYAQLAYGAVILSFLGGIKWGCAISDSSAQKPSWTNLGLSTVSSLTAWTALLVPQQLGVIIVATGISVATYIDLISIGYPPWFKALRITLSSFAVTTLVVMLILSLIQKEKTEKQNITDTSRN